MTIVDTVRGDILDTPCRHILFGIGPDTEDTTEGFAGYITTSIWPELPLSGFLQPGQALTKEWRSSRLHALCCYDLQGNWQYAPEIVYRYLESLRLEANEMIASVLIGAGPIGQQMGADWFLIMGAMARSQKRVVLYRT